MKILVEVLNSSFGTANNNFCVEYAKFCEPKIVLKEDICGNSNTCGLHESCAKVG